MNTYDWAISHYYQVKIILFTNGIKLQFKTYIDCPLSQPKTCYTYNFYLNKKQTPCVERIKMSDFVYDKNLKSL